MAAPKGNQYAKGNKGGRPKIWTDDAIYDMSQRLREFIQKDVGIYLNSFCVQEKINPDLLSQWANSNEEFAGSLKEAKQWQEEKLIRKSLSREWDGSFARYVMARTCGDKWKASWDQPEDKGEATPSTIIINKIEK